MSREHPETAAFGHQVWPARAGALTLIRREVRRWLAPLEVMPDAEADLVLAVNEAATNVIDHAYRAPGDQGVVEVFFWTEPGAVFIEVVDHGRWRPPDPHAGGLGLGIEIMQRLAEAVLIHHDGRDPRAVVSLAPRSPAHGAPAHRLTDERRVNGNRRQGPGRGRDRHRDAPATWWWIWPAELVVNRVAHRAETTR